jgi:hypothetical protein
VQQRRNHIPRTEKEATLQEETKEVTGKLNSLIKQKSSSEQNAKQCTSSMPAPLEREKNPMP